MKKRVLSILLSALTLMPLCCMSLTAAESDTNKAPTVIPAIREWEGTVGTYTLPENFKVNVSEAEISEAKKDIIKESFINYLDKSISFTDAGGDITLKSVPENDKLGYDGYTMEVTDNGITVSASADIGLLYGIYTILQSAKTDVAIPCGNASDYSYYQIRGGMIDVARAWIPLDYVEEITKYCSFFKLNEIHLHINDTGANNYHIFRLESDVKGLTATDGYYTKDEYRAYQKRMLEYGIEVVTEIDTPAHSSCFNAVIPELMLDTNHLDISNPEAIQFVKDLFDEYITGDDPVFVSKRVHIGTDEYPEGYNELMRTYTDELIKHINSRGYIPRFWGSFGGDGFNGTTPVSSDAEANFWAVSLSDYNTLLDMGYDIINTCGPVLYIVPGGNYGFSDYYDLYSKYSSWYVNYMGYDKSTAIAADHKQLLGGNFALWNDLHTEYGGFSQYDIFDRLRGAVCLISEKTWCGEQTKKIDAADFVSRYEKLSLYAATGDPGNHKISEIKDTVPEGTEAFGWPYVASVDVTIDSLDKEIVLFGGDAGEFYIAKDGSAGFRRDVYGYNFTYKCKLEAGKTVNIKLIADNKQTLLCVDDTYYYHPKNNKASMTRSSTFVLPLEVMGKDLEGKISNLSVKSETVNLNNKLVTGNYALNKPATVSALEVNDGRFTQHMALDGDENTRLSFSAKADYQWLVVDLESVRSVNKVVIKFNEHISDYKVSVSEDGENYTEVAHVQKGDDMAKQTDVVEFDDIDARFIKYEQFKRFYVSDWNAYYSGGILEFEVYGFDEKPYNALVEKAVDYLAADKSGASFLRSPMAALDNYLNSNEIYSTHLKALYNHLKAEIEAYEAVKDNSVSDEASQNDSSEAVQNPSSKLPLGVWLGIGAAVAAAVAAIIIFKKKKK